MSSCLPYIQADTNHHSFPHCCLQNAGVPSLPGAMKAAISIQPDGELLTSTQTIWACSTVVLYSGNKLVGSTFFLCLKIRFQLAGKCALYRLQDG